MSFDLFAESSRAYEEDNKKEKVVIMNKKIWKRFCKYADRTDVNMTFDEFVDKCLNNLGF